jgi:hypothetical protein
LVVPEEELNFFETDGLSIFNIGKIIDSNNRKYFEIVCKIVEIGGVTLKLEPQTPSS